MKKWTDVKYTDDKSLISENIERIRIKKGMYKSDLARKADLTRQGLENILKGATPRKDNLYNIAKALGVTPELLRDGIIHFDYDIFCQKLYARFPYQINEKDFEKYLVNSIYDNPDSVDIEGFLIWKFDIDPVSFLIKHELPSKDIQASIAEYFEYSISEIFVTYGGIPVGSDVDGYRHLNVCDKKEFDNRNFIALFNNLNLKHKKMVYNICLDLLKIQNN